MIEAYLGTGDLTGWHSNGSDERDCADQWYERAFGMWISYFRSHLFNYYNDLDIMKEMLEDTDFFEEVYEGYKSENAHKDIESKEDCLELLKEIIEEGKEL